MVMSVYAAVQARHFHLASSSLQCSLTSIQQLQQQLPTPSLSAPPTSHARTRHGHTHMEDTAAAGEQWGEQDSLLLNFVSNMSRILQGEHVQQEIRCCWFLIEGVLKSSSSLPLPPSLPPSLPLSLPPSPPSLSPSCRTHFSQCLQEQVLPLAQLLVLALPRATLSTELVATFDLLRLVLEPQLPSSAGVKAESGEEGVAVTLRPQCLSRLLQALLKHHFSLMKMLVGSLIQGESEIK